MKKILSIFIVAFLLNFIWENAHSFLYTHYMGSRITEFILLRASVVDAIVITLIALPFLYIAKLQDKSWLIIVAGILIAICIEWYALGAGRWVYNASMPIIPLLEVGLTPTIQLGLLGYFSYWLVMRKK